MARGPLTFRQRDVVAAMKAVERAGHKVGRVEIGRDGTIAVIVADEAAPSANEWDAVFDDAPAPALHQ